MLACSDPSFPHLFREPVVIVLTFYLPVDTVVTWFSLISIVVSERDLVVNIWVFWVQYFLSNVHRSEKKTCALGKRKFVSIIVISDSILCVKLIHESYFQERGF
jgi:hypothetical protein